MKKLLGRIQIESDRYVRNNFFRNKVFPGYSKIVDKNNVAIYRANELKEQIVAAFNTVVVTQYIHKKKQQLFIYPNYSRRSFKYRIEFNNRVFPGLIDGSRIMNCIVVPFMREVSPDRYYKRWRLVVFTDKCQVYHNFPARNVDLDGFEELNDIKRFEESVVWDIPGRKYPSLNSETDATEMYYPFLPKECYEYHPSVHARSPYGNLGFGKSTEVEIENGRESVSRFYFHNRSFQANPFNYMGGIELDYKMSLIGTYQSNKNTGIRTTIFATSDGGRSWYAKYEFSDEGEYEFRQGSDEWGKNFGNPIILGVEKTLFPKAHIRKRNLEHSCENDVIKWDEPIQIESVSFGKLTTIKTVVPHNLKTGNIIALVEFDSSGITSELQLLYNNEICDDGSGNGKMYKVDVIDSTSFILYECVANPFVAHACRHIHHINRVRDGWIVGTGEIYPNGWIMYIQMKEADTFSRKSASDYFRVFFLTSSPQAVQRTLGLDLIDGQEPTIVFASDHDTLIRSDFTTTRSEVFSRNSTGIYYGLLKNINDFSSFQIVFEAREPAYLFKKIDGVYLFSGQRGEIALSNDLERWETFSIDQPLTHYRGKTFRFYVFDKYIVEIR